MQISGKTAVVTGAGSGLGAALSRVLAARGAKLVLVDVNEAGLAATAADIPGAVVRRVDVSDARALEGLATELAGQGGAQILVNNAGLTVLASFANHTPEDWDRVIGVNLMGVVHGCRAFLPQLQKTGGWIVNISSVFGIVGVPGQTAYCASKFAVRGFTEALQEELRGTNVGITLVHPGGLRTNIISGARTSTQDPTAADNLKAFFAKQTMPPEKAAARIAKAIEREDHRVRICAETFAMDWMRRLAPEWGNQVSVGMMTRLMGLDKNKL